MTDLSPRETAARAAGAVLWNVRNYPERAQAAMLGQDTGPLRDKVTDAVLAAVAAHDGLAEVLRAHRPVAMGAYERRWYECSGCDETAADIERFIAAHLADVVRAWMVQT